MHNQFFAANINEGKPIEDTSLFNDAHLTIHLLSHANP